MQAAGTYTHARVRTQALTRTGTKEQGIAQAQEQLHQEPPQLVPHAERRRRMTEWTGKRCRVMPAVKDALVR